MSFREIEEMFIKKSNHLFESWSKEILLKYFSKHFSKHFIENIDNVTYSYQMSVFDDEE